MSSTSTQWDPKVDDGIPGVSELLDQNSGKNMGKWFLFS